MSEEPLKPPTDPTPPAKPAEKPVEKPAPVKGTLIGAAPVHFFIHRFLFGFCSHPLLPLTLVAIVALALGLGEGFGVTDLIYHENRWQQMFGGAVMAYVVVACAYAGFLFDTRRFPLGEGHGRWYDVPHWGFWWYFAGIVGSFLTVLLVGAAVYAAILGVLVWKGSVSGLTKVSNPLALFNDSTREYVWFPLGMATGVASAIVLGTVSYRFWEAASPRIFGAEPGSEAGVARGEAAAVAEQKAPVAPQPGAGPRWVQYVRPLWLGGGEYPAWWLSLWLLGVFLILHVGTSWVVYETKAGAWRGAAGTAGLLALVCWWRHRQLAGLLRSARAGLGSRDYTGLERYAYRGSGVLFVGLTLLLFGLADNLANKEFGQPTPVPLFGAAMFVLISVYTGVVLAYRRAVPVIALGALVLLVFAGIPPYKFRFPGLEDVYHAHPGADGRAGPLDLRDRARKEGEAWLPHQTRLKELTDQGLNPVANADKFEAVRTDIIARDYRLIPPPAPDWPAPQQEDWGKADWKARRDRWRKPGEVTVPYYHIPFPAPEKGHPLAEADKKPLFIISVSGGGHAAAVWTLGVLNRLERAFAEAGVDFPAHVLLITGASGGMMGAAYYVTSLPEHSRGPDREAFLAAVRKSDPPCEACVGGRLGEDVQKLLAEDFLSPLVNRMLFNDGPAYFSPFPNFQDRGRRLDERWEEWVLNERAARGEREKAGGREPRWGPPDPVDEKSPFAMSFADLKARELRGRYPFLVFAPMMIEDGRRLLISNLDLESVASNDGNGLDRTTASPALRDARGLNYNFSRGELELFRLFPEQHGTFKLSTAVRMSATFPFFSPAVSLPTAPRRRVVDAGYYDNYGVCVAASWLFSTDHQEWMDAHVSKVAVIQIRSSASERSRRLEEVPEPDDHLLSRAMEELLSPVEGLNQARVGSASFRNDGQLELLSKWFRTRKDTVPRDAHMDRYFTTVTFELEKDVTLSWYLGKRDRATIKDALTPNPDWAKWQESRTGRTGAEDPPADLPRTAVDEKIDYLLKWYKRPRPESKPQPPPPAKK